MNLSEVAQAKFDRIQSLTGIIATAEKEIEEILCGSEDHAAETVAAPVKRQYKKKDKPVEVDEETSDQSHDFASKAEAIRFYINKGLKPRVIVEEVKKHGFKKCAPSDVYVEKSKMKKPRPTVEDSSDDSDSENDAGGG